jgi:hypothetical protein
VDHLFLFHELADGNWLGFDDATQGVTFEIVTPDGTQVAVSETVPAPAGSVFVRPAADGFVLAYATATSLPSSGGIVLRLGSDLRLDPSFGESGVASSDFPVEDMSVTSDGKIVIAGDGRLTRLNPDGSPDPTFRNGAAADLLDLVGGVPACHESALIVDGEDRITFPWTNAGNELHLLRFLP